MSKELQQIDSSELLSVVEWVIERFLIVPAPPGQFYRVLDDDDAIELAKYCDQLVAWKESALAVEKEWDEQAIAAMLGGKMGESCRAVIAREVPLVIERLAAAQDEVEGLKKVLRQLAKKGTGPGGGRLDQYSLGYDICAQEVRVDARAALSKSNKIDKS